MTGFLALLLMAQQPPFLARHCSGCHGPGQAAGGFNLAALQPPAAGNVETWARILRRVQAGEMPPKPMPRPDAAESAAFTGWVSGELRRLERPLLTRRRLNRVEYDNTVRDLLGVDVHAAEDFPQDDSVFGFDNIAEALTVSPLLVEKQFAAAERIARQALFGPETRTATTRWEVPIPRRMEVTNPVKITVPAYYSMADYDVTGQSQPGAFHKVHRFPADGEYVFRVTGSTNRPEGSEPGEMTFLVDGKLVRRFPVESVEMSGFERRPDYWEVRVPLTAGMHEIVAAFPRQFEGLPPRFKGPNPSTLPQQPVVDPDLTYKPPPPGTPPHKVEERRLGLERAREQFRNPRYEGMAVVEVEVTGPYAARKGPTAESLRRVFVCGHLDGRHEAGCARKIVSTLAGRAFRRAVSPAEVDRLTGLAAGAVERGGSFAEGLVVAIQAMLVSPSFLFRGDGAGDYDLASRLSYFLWSTMPDDALLRRAGEGTLRQPEVLAAEVRRMLADGRSRALVANFAGQWLEIRRMESVQPDRDRFPDFDDYLRTSMVRETELFFANLIREDRSILDLIDGRYSFLNERLARHYGIGGVKGTEFRRVGLEDAGRSGIVTQASILTASSYATRTSPVLRGKWVLENLLNAAPPPPPPDVPALDVNGVGESASLRVQLEAHRRNQVCASCHARMDPLGFSLENYDAVGAWRTREGKIAIDPSGALPDGTPLAGPDSLKAVLRRDKDAFAACLVEKLLTYALGRAPRQEEAGVVRQIVADAAADRYRFSRVIGGVVRSASFLQGGER